MSVSLVARGQRAISGSGAGESEGLENASGNYSARTQRAPWHTGALEHTASFSKRARGLNALAGTSQRGERNEPVAETAEPNS